MPAAASSFLLFELSEFQMDFGFVLGNAVVEGSLFACYLVGTSTGHWKLEAYYM
jgi:hypothetical protein